MEKASCKACKQELARTRVPLSTSVFDSQNLPKN